MGGQRSPTTIIPPFLFWHISGENDTCTCIRCSLPLLDTLLAPGPWEQGQVLWVRRQRLINYLWVPSEHKSPQSRVVIPRIAGTGSCEHNSPLARSHPYHTYTTTLMGCHPLNRSVNQYSTNWKECPRKGSQMPWIVSMGEDKERSRREHTEKKFWHRQ